MFFAKRRWALRVTEKMGLETTSLAATQIVEMLIQGANQMQQMAKSAGQRLSDAELILMSAATMSVNRSAQIRLIEECGFSPEQSLRTLQSVHTAGRELALAQGYTEMVERMFDGR